MRRQDQLRERQKPLLLRDQRPRPALRPVGPVQILQCDHRHRPIQIPSKLRGHFPLGCNRRSDLLPARLQIPEIVQPLRQAAQLRIIQRAVLFLTVARNERNRASLIDQLDHRLHLPWRDIHLPRDCLCDIHKNNLQNSHDKSMFPLICLPFFSGNCAPYPDTC